MASAFTVDQCPCGEFQYSDELRHTCRPPLLQKRPLPGLYRIDNGLQLVMEHGSLYVKFPRWIGNMIWRWRHHHRARAGEAPVLPDLSGLPTTRAALRGLFDRAYKEHDAWRKSVFYKGVDVRARPWRYYQ